jgi:Ca2+-transporting ATPase
MSDPPRKEAIAAIRTARKAGIGTLMITGDHPTTARAIARELGLLAADQAPEGIVHARATPADKIEIVRGWKQKGHIVAMTGDGANDAPALREAHIGIAMGKTGTEVSREASDIVLTDDNFASIVEAIREGRGIFDNIRKTLVFLLSGNAAELVVMFAAVALGMPLPLLPLQLLWINLITDGLPALALVVDPVAADVMDKPPRPVAEPILTRLEWRRILGSGLLQATVALAVFAWSLQKHDLAQARSLTFSTLVFAELFRSFGARDSSKTIWQLGILSNGRLAGVVFASVLAQLVLMQLEFTQRVFHLSPASWSTTLLSMLFGLAPAALLEIAKLTKRLANAS